MTKHYAVTAAAVAAALWAAPALAQDKVCDNPRQMQGFSTCADIAKAEAEGGLVQYSTDPERGQVALLKAFTDMFPKIKTSYVRLQAGALYAKILAERQAKSYLADVIFLSDMGMVLDFQARGGFTQYVSPEMAAYKPQYKSSPEGFFTWGCIISAGIAYNPNVIKPEDAPKSWEDLLDPKWKDAMNVKVANSGLQMAAWYVLKPILGDGYFEQLGGIRPRAFDSYVQQYGRLIDGQDKVIMAAQYSGYVEFKAKGAPLAFVAPATGLPAAQQSFGIVSNGPNPNAAQLFVDWFLSPVGQTVYAKVLLNHSAREDVDPPPGALPIAQMKLLFPNDYADFQKQRPTFVKDWNKIVGAR